MKHDVKDTSLSAAGKLRVEWAERSMPVLRSIRERFEKERPLKGVRMGACLHVTTETANLMATLKAGGAEVTVCASNPLSTNDEVAAWLVDEAGISTFAVHGVDRDGYYGHIMATLDAKPQITMDDGADLVSTLHGDRASQLPEVIGGTEETTTGVIRLRSMQKNGVLHYPIIAVNDAKTKHFFDNRYGTGQSTVDGILRATNVLLAGSNVVVAGYGWCGRGFAMRASGMGANVIVVEVDALKAIEAVMDGYRVMPIAEASKIGDVFCTLTGDINVIRPEHFKVMKDGAIVCNSGHFNVELDLEGLAKMAKARREVRPGVEEFTLEDGRRVNILVEGRLVNLAAAEGHPASVMDMSFANQALCAEYMVGHAKELERKVYPVPEHIDDQIARHKLDAMGVSIDTLTEEQVAYLASWEMGT
jgi:adenosylhomocysteinase